MDKQKFNRTALAIDEVQNALTMLQQKAENKKNALGQQRQSYRHNITEKDARIETLNKTVAAALEKVGGVVEKIDMVLNEDGSSNNNN